MASIERDADGGFGWILTLKPDEKHKNKCVNCGEICKEGFWCDNKRDLFCNLCQERIKMYYCKGLYNSEHTHLKISQIKVRLKKK